MRILVVGGAGFVGSTSVETFVDAGHDVVVYDDLSSGHAGAVVRPARLALGWHPEHSKLEQMLADAWAWRLTHPNGYAKGPRTDGAVTLERSQPDVRPDRPISRPGAPASA